MMRKFVFPRVPWSLLVRCLPLWTLLLVVLLAAAALWGPGIVNTRGGGDSPFLLQRLHQMAANLRAGVFPVRWMPDAAYGLGYPFFNHYSALPFYVAALFTLLGLDPLTALKLTQTLGFLIAALAMYGWVNHLWRNRAAAWLAAVAYTVAPFHLVNVYVRGDSLSEFYAFAFYPLILWALGRVVTPSPTSVGAPPVQQPANRFGRQPAHSGAIGVLGLAYAGLILSHNISAFIFSPFALLYLLLLLGTRGRGRGLLKPFSLGLVGLLLGAALSAWAWLPALLERDYVQSGTLTLGYFNYAHHFRSANLVQPGLFFDYSIAVTTDGPSPFAMGGPQALVGVVGLLIALRLARARGRTANGPAPFIYLLTGLLLSTAMITPLSRPLWDRIPLLEMVQFPWRFLSVQALFAAAVAGVWVLRLQGRLAWGGAVVVAMLLMASTLLPLQPERLLIGPDDVTPTRLQEYELFTGNIGTTIRWEWLPRAAAPRPFTFDTLIEPDVPPQPVALAGTLDRAVQTRRRPTERVWRVQTGDEGATLAFPLLYWPGWRAQVDGERAPPWAVEGSGYLALDVPAGEHTVRLELGRTSLRARAEILSLATFLVLVACVLWRVRYWVWGHFPLQRGQVFRHSFPILSSLLILLAGLLYWGLRSSPPPNRRDDLTMDFVDKPYLHHHPDGVDVDDQARLLSYAFSAEQLNPGDTLTVTLNWAGGAGTAAGTRVSLRLVSPAEHLPDLKSGPYALCETSEPLAATTVHRLTLPENTPRGLYLLQLRLERPDGNTQGRGSFYLRPVRVTRGAPLAPDAPLLAVVGPDIRLHAVQFEPGPQPGDLTVRLEWSTVRRLASNYKVSLRLLDPVGHERFKVDPQPGYGFTPTSLWRPGERIGDRYNLQSLPDDLPPGDGYRLLLLFYREPSHEVARVVLGPFALPLESPVVFEPPPRLFELPSLSRPLDVDFAGQIRLAGYELGAEAQALDLTLWWVARRQPQKDYTVFVHLFDPATETIVAQHDAMPRQGSYPTSGWLAGEVVSETVRLSLDSAPPGSYRLAVGLYDLATADRLPAMAPDGTLLPHQRLILPDEVEVPGE